MKDENQTNSAIVLILKKGIISKIPEPLAHTISILLGMVGGEGEMTANRFFLIPTVWTRICVRKRNVRSKWYALRSITFKIFEKSAPFSNTERNSLKQKPLFSVNNNK